MRTDFNGHARRRERGDGRSWLAVLEYDALAPAGHFVKLGPYNLFWIFISMSVLGMFVETLVSFPADGVWKDRAGLVWGPLSPIYGCGALLMTLFLNNMKDRSNVHLFVKAGIVGALLELFAGWTMKTLYGAIAWSYIDQPFNIGGYTCLGMAIVWGIAGFVWMKFFLVPVVHLVQLIPAGHPRTVVTALVAVFLAADVVMTFVSMGFYFDRMAGVPVETPIQQFFADRYSDSFMQNRFQTISIYTDLATR